MTTIPEGVLEIVSKQAAKCYETNILFWYLTGRTTIEHLGDNRFALDAEMEPNNLPYDPFRDPVVHRVEFTVEPLGHVAFDAQDPYILAASEAEASAKGW
jgi:hypothetical protein